ncbi:MAG: hypothetical protein D6728_04375 [Cyanobacteria bacterium J055]|nr:MAG: hypothetical protein D6728_04375 [Cyanobacteria bacterium J055]
MVIGHLGLGVWGLGVGVWGWELEWCVSYLNTPYQPISDRWSLVTGHCLLRSQKTRASND